MKKVEIREAQKLMTTILRDFDKICRENNLQYWLVSGTLLGARRHGGFIPWDDDIDVAMMRDDYNKFIEIANDVLPGDLFYQDITTEEGIVYGWAKIRHKHSKLIEENDAKYKEGMFIDIFPYDYYESREDYKLKIKHKNFRRLKLVYNSNLDYEKNLVKNIKRFCCKTYNSLILKKSIKDVVIDAREFAKNCKFEKKEYLGEGAEILVFNDFFHKDIIYPLGKITFEGMEFYAPNKVDDYLRIKYGDDYMELPKEENRINHNLSLHIEKNRD